MAIVLVIIGVITGAVMVGTDVLRHAKGQNLFSTFIVGWSEAFTQHVRTTGVLPGDAAGSNRINGGGALCGAALGNTFLQAGIRIPKGRGNGLEDQYLYQDASGSPQQISVCFVTANWSVRTATGFAVVPRHLMRITGLTAELAIQLDSLIDGHPSANLGQFRQVGLETLSGGAPAGWPAAAAPGGVPTVVTAFLEMF